MKKRIFLLLLCLALLLTGCAASRRTPKQTFRIYGLSGAPGGGLRKIAGQRLAGALRRAGGRCHAQGQHLRHRA